MPEKPSSPSAPKPKPPKPAAPSPGVPGPPIPAVTCPPMTAITFHDGRSTHVLKFLTDDEQQQVCELLGIAIPNASTNCP